MADQEKDKGLKEGEKETPGGQPDPNKPGSEVDKGDLKNQGEETPQQKAEKLLKDGTPADKEIKVNKKTFDDRNDKAKLYETHAPLLDKVLKDPGLVERLLETQEKGDLGVRLSKLEEDRKLEKQRELREAVTEAVSNWPDFEKSWPEVKSLFESLSRQGLPSREALRRAYFAVNPEAAAAEAERAKQEGHKALGVHSSPAGYPSKAGQPKEKPNLSDGERHMARVFGKSEEEYGKMMETHKTWLKERGFYDVE